MLGFLHRLALLLNVIGHELRKVFNLTRASALVLIMTIAFLAITLPLVLARNYDATPPPTSTQYEFEILVSQIENFRHNTNTDILAEWNAFMSAYTPFFQATIGNLRPFFNTAHSAWNNRFHFAFQRNFLDNTWFYLPAQDLDNLRNSVYTINYLFVQGASTTTEADLNFFRGQINAIIISSSQVENLLQNATALSLTNEQIAKLSLLAGNLVGDGYSTGEYWHMVGQILAHNLELELGVPTTLTNTQFQIYNHVHQNGNLPSDYALPFAFGRGVTIMDFMFDALLLAIGVIVALVIAFIYFSVFRDFKRGTVALPLINGRKRWEVLATKFGAASLFGLALVLAFTIMFAIAGSAVASGAALPMIFVLGSGTVWVLPSVLVFIMLLLGLFILVMLISAIGVAICKRRDIWIS